MNRFSFQIIVKRPVTDSERDLSEPAEAESHGHNPQTTNKVTLQSKAETGETGKERGKIWSITGESQSFLCDVIDPRRQVVPHQLQCWKSSSLFVFMDNIIITLHLRPPANTHNYANTWDSPVLKDGQQQSEGCTFSSAPQWTRDDQRGARSTRCRNQHSLCLTSLVCALFSLVTGSVASDFPSGRYYQWYSSEATGWTGQPHLNLYWTAQAGKPLLFLNLK